MTDSGGGFAAFQNLHYRDLSLLIFINFLFLATSCIKKEYNLKLYVCILGVFESHGTLVPNVSVIAPEKLSASARRRQEIQVHTHQISIKK